MDKIRNGERTWITLVIESDSTNVVRSTSIPIAVVRSGGVDTPLFRYSVSPMMFRQFKEPRREFMYTRETNRNSDCFVY